MFVLHVDRFFDLLAARDRWLFEFTTSTYCTHSTSAVEFLLITFERTLNVLSFFYGYNQHTECI